MFTGIVQAQGTVVAVRDDGERSRVTLTTPAWEEPLVLGESIAVNGVCLTVAHSEGTQWEADVMRVTREVTTLAALAPGQAVNLERAMRADGRWGGHILQGHVDAVATLVERSSGPEWDDFTFAVPAAVARYVVLKGSIGIDGTSLTVAGLEDAPDAAHVTVSLIPTTLAETTLGGLRVGARVNVEVDIVAKYVERLMGAHA